MLPKQKRLTKKRDFMKLATHGRPIFGPYATLRVRVTPNEGTRVAFITSTKVFKLAVHRNRAKRRMREAVRALWPELPADMHLLFVLKPEAMTAPFPRILEEVRRLVGRIPDELTKPPKMSSRGKKYSKTRRQATV